MVLVSFCFNNKFLHSICVAKALASLTHAWVQVPLVCDVCA